MRREFQRLKLLKPILGTVTDPQVRRAVRRALAHHLGLDVPAIADGARFDQSPPPK